MRKRRLPGARRGASASPGLFLRSLQFARGKADPDAVPMPAGRAAPLRLDVPVIVGAAKCRKKGHRGKPASGAVCSRCQQVVP